MAISCVRKLEFDAAHRVMEHESQCKYLHGHRYKLEAFFEAKELDALGRVVDFGKIKELLGAWIDEYWDHATILFDKDKELGEAIASITQQKIFYLDSNPTAENMALFLLHHVCPKLFEGHDIVCTEIILHETPNCFVRAVL